MENDAGAVDDVDGESRGPLDGHLELSPGERAVLALLAHGESDERILMALRLTPAALRSRLNRLAARTGLAGRRRIAWAARHVECCIAKQA